MGVEPGWGRVGDVFLKNALKYSCRLVFLYLTRVLRDAEKRNYRVRSKIKDAPPVKNQKCWVIGTNKQEWLDGILRLQASDVEICPRSRLVRLGSRGAVLGEEFSQSREYVDLINELQRTPKYIDTCALDEVRKSYEGGSGELVCSNPRIRAESIRRFESAFVEARSEALGCLKMEEGLSEAQVPV